MSKQTRTSGFARQGRPQATLPHEFCSARIGSAPSGAASPDHGPETGPGQIPRTPCKSGGRHCRTMRRKPSG